jgi:hypothetical protein
MRVFPGGIVLLAQKQFRPWHTLNLARGTPLGALGLKKSPTSSRTNSDKYCAFDRRSQVYLFFILHDGVGVESCAQSRGGIMQRPT